MRLPYVQYNLLLCCDNSVDLELVCSSPPEFKDKLWKNYEHSGCGNDSTDVEEVVDVIASINHTSSQEQVAKYNDQMVTHSYSRLEQAKLVRTFKNYLYISLALFVLFLCLLLITFFLLWYCVRPRILRGFGPAKSDAETHRISISTI